ncbi:MAG: putative heme d1 biosynthesis radical SAM protein NirJ1 [Ruminiclostridium sp.]|nr:putative heme d1 biosynthesis radical SAM protein NirJ1 [Ruminiclostridium sp.]
MISISRLLSGDKYFGDSLRYSHGAKGSINGATGKHGPVVVWNSTQTCNLKCVHCYANAGCSRHEGELTTGEAKKFIEDLGNFSVPVLLFSGGEPLVRDDIFELVKYCHTFNIRPTLSTNGTLISKEVARKIKDSGVGYVGISIDGIGEDNDKFRGQKGAFDNAVKGIRNCKEAGQRVGLRFTINSHNLDSLTDIFYLIKEENIDRVCFYHLVYSGRGLDMLKEDITHEETREAMDLIIGKTLDFHNKGFKKEILTVDNHADGIYLYLKYRQENPEIARNVLDLLSINGGNRTGIAFGEVDSLGFVHPDQFTQNHTLGNIKETSFKDIWTDMNHPITAGLKNRKPLLKGRCSKCKWLDLCNGNFRARAEAVTGDFWESDPACFLTDKEIGLELTEPDKTYYPQ